MEIWESLKIIFSKLGCAGGKAVQQETEADREQAAVPPPVVRVRRFHQRGDTLLAEMVTAIARNIWCHSSTDLCALPADLAQLILDELIMLGKLSRSSLALFSNQLVYSLRLEDYPGVGNDWMRLLSSSSLLVVNLSRCTQVGDQSLMALEGQAFLEQLHLDGCRRITDDGLAHLAGLSRLQHLSLEDNKQLTSAGVEHLGGLHALTCLNLRACSKASGFHYLTGLVELQRLNAGWCSLVGDDDVQALAALTNLADLELARSQVGVRGMKALGGLPGITSLNLAGCGKLCDACMPHVAGMSGLKALNLMWCGGFSDHGRRPSGITQKGLRLLGSLHELQDLNVGYNPHLTDGCLLEWSNLKKLRSVSLDSCSNVANRGLAVFQHLTEVQELDLSDTDVDDLGLRHLSGLQNLNHLNLSFSGVTDGGLGELACFGELTRLHLDSRGIGNQGAKHLGKLTQLRHLDLFGSRLSDKGCQHLSGLTQLECLEICNGLISDKGVEHFKGLANLKSLSLATNQAVTDVSLLVLSKLMALTSLNLAGSRVTGNGIQTLKSLESLEMLVLRRTRARKIAGDRLKAQLPRLHSVQC